MWGPFGVGRDPERDRAVERASGSRRASARLPPLLLLICGSLVAIVLSVAGVGSLLGTIENHDLRAMHRTFIGLSRQRVYERLSSMSLEARSWRGDARTGNPLGERWPAGGPIFVALPYVARAGGGGCGDYALAVVQFANGRVSSVGDAVWIGECGI